MANPRLAVLDPGLSSTIQDAGRFGYRRFGVSTSGTADNLSMAIANRLVGNADGEATVEMTLSGGSYRVEAQHCRVAVAGADMTLSVNGEEVPSFSALDLKEDDELRIGSARTGLRAYLAVAGGFAIPPALDSRSTHARSGLGGLAGCALASGDELPLNCEHEPTSPPLELPRDHWPDFGGPIRVILGPQADAFTKKGISAFIEGPYTVSNKSDRMGCQLEGPVIEHRDGFNIISDGVIAGSIQVPGHGRPLLLLADCQTTGGYPKIATVVSADLFKAGQRRPGEEVRFVAVGDAEAARLRSEKKAFLDALPSRFRIAIRGPRTPSAADLLSNNLVSGVVAADVQGEARRRRFR